MGYFVMYKLQKLSNKNNEYYLFPEGIHTKHTFTCR